MQITLFRDDEYMVGLDIQSFRDQLNRHFGVFREDLVEHGGYGPQVINNDDSNTHIRGQMLQQPDIGVEAAGRTTHANDGKVM